MQAHYLTYSNTETVKRFHHRSNILVLHSVVKITMKTYFVVYSLILNDVTLLATPEFSGCCPMCVLLK